jgi:hypothetical protein
MPDAGNTSKLLLVVKIGLAVFYLLTLAGPWLPMLTSYLWPMQLIMLFLLAAHLLEYFWHRKRLLGIPGHNHFFQTLLFGLLYWLPLLRAEKS